METWTNGPVTLYTGHVLEVLRGLPAESVQCVVTSPPYWGLRDYKLEPVVWDDAGGCEHEWGQERIASRGHPGTLSTLVGTQTAELSKMAGHQGSFCSLCNAWRGSLGLEPTPQLYVRHLVAVFREVRRVLRNDGTLWLNLGDSYAGSGVQHEHHSNPGLSKAGQREGFRPGAGRANGVVDARGQRNQDGVGPVLGLKPKDLVGIPWMVAFALQEDGWWLRSDIIWAKPNPMPESVTDRPTRSHEYVFQLTKSERYYWDQEAVREFGSSGPSDRRKMLEGLPRIGGKAKELDDPFNKASKATHIGQARAVGSINRNIRSVWAIATQPYSGAHFATFPEALVERCILAGTSEHGACPECGAPWERIVSTKAEDPPASPSCAHADLVPVPCLCLDPFSGAGTVALVAQKLGRRAIGIDLSEKYTALAVKRLEGIPMPLPLAGGS